MYRHVVFLDTVIEDVQTHVAAFPPERGGALLGPVGQPIVSRFIHDERASVSRSTFTPSRHLQRLVNEAEQGNGRLLEMKGILHSHPSGMDYPSGGDRFAFADSLSRAPWLGRFICPIVTRQVHIDADDRHRVPMASGVMSVYVAEVNSRNQIGVETALAHVLPVFRDTSALAARLGGVAAPTTLTDVDGTVYPTGGVRLSGGNVAILYASTYPMSAPLVLVTPSVDDGRASSDRRGWPRRREPKRDHHPMIATAMELAAANGMLPGDTVALTLEWNLMIAAEERLVTAVVPFARRPETPRDAAPRDWFPDFGMLAFPSTSQHSTSTVGSAVAEVSGPVSREESESSPGRVYLWTPGQDTPVSASKASPAELTSWEEPSSDSPAESSSPPSDESLEAWPGAATGPGQTQAQTPDPAGQHPVTALDGIRGRLKDIVSETVSSKRVLVVGAGSGGSLTVEALTRSGVSDFVVIDPDEVAPENLSRSVYGFDDLGDAKVVALARKMLQINPNVTVIAINGRLQDLDNAQIDELISSADLVVAATDDPKTQLLLNHFAYARGIPAVFGGMYKRGHAGEVCLVLKDLTHCFRCQTGRRSGEQRAGELNYGTGRLSGEPALGADIAHVVSASVKLALGLLELEDTESASSARQLVLDALSAHSTLLIMSMVPNFAYFPKIFGEVKGQLGYQSLWFAATGDPECTVCGEQRIDPCSAAVSGPKLGNLVLDLREGRTLEPVDVSSASVLGLVEPQMFDQQPDQMPKDVLAVGGTLPASADGAPDVAADTNRVGTVISSALQNSVAPVQVSEKAPVAQRLIAEQPALVEPALVELALLPPDLEVSVMNGALPERPVPHDAHEETPVACESIVDSPVRGEGLTANGTASGAAEST